MTRLTPSQTIGPFFLEGLRWATDSAPRDFGLPVVRVTGKVLDGNGEPVPDALIEVWQPGFVAHAYPGARLPGFQRVDTRRGGRFEFWVEEPRGTTTVAHVTIFARGLLNGLFTRVHVPHGDDVADVAVPSAVPVERRDTLVARRCASHARTFEWDIRLTGPGETVFFDL
ncbi:MAG: protocatechuate 3,4-dioxygenase subunit alpha [Betaproteobacteria bacterium]|nr:protocatechuate 3,4-dioxygenase subunit alpha [Betaproteobacteria bacterium]